MSETITPIPPATTPRQRAEISRDLLHNISEGKAVALAAQMSEYAPKLLAFTITPEKAAQLLEKSIKAAEMAAQVVSLRRDSKVGTRRDEEEKFTLIEAIERIQTGAHLKYDGESNRALREDNLKRYFVGNRLDVADNRLETIALAVLEELKKEELPSVGPAEIEALKTALADWENGVDADADASPSAQALYEQLVALSGEITIERRQIQIAANAAFPFRKETNAAARKAFHIPEHRPFI